MKTQRWVYVVLALLSVGAGVAIAGVPDQVPRDPTIAAPAGGTVDAAPRPTDATGSDAPAATTATTAGDGTSADDGATRGTAGDTTPASSPVDGTTAPAGDGPAGTDAPPGTTGAATSVAPAPPRAELAVAVANGASVGGAASEVSAALEAVGYVDVGSFDGTEIVDLTTVYRADGYEAAADELVAAMGVAPDLVRPLAELPRVDGLGDQPVVVYLGRDVVDLPIYAR